ncbi:MAG: integrin alpha [Phycisphaera sp.]|nr:MAG: integrin alpha [Phycisphaera sp.]
MRTDGTVRSYTKISNFSGDLGVTLEPGDFFGYSLALLGDVDGDGVRDLAIGAPNDDDGGSNAGAIYVLFMQPDGTVKITSKISNSAGGLGDILSAGDQFGQAAGCSGDLDGDGLVELLVGAPNDGTTGTRAGAAYVISLTAAGTASAVRKIDGDDVPVLPGDSFGGRHICSLGDVNGDGHPDLAVGAFLDDGSGRDRGAFWVVMLDETLAPIAATEIGDGAGGFDGELNDDDIFGMALAPLGDWDGDGVPDIIVGSNRDDDGGEDRGAVFVCFLQTDGSVREWFKISELTHPDELPIVDGDRFGRAMGFVGDLRGDGSMSVVAGAGAGPVTGGAVVLLHLTKSCQSLADLDGDGELTLFDFLAFQNAFDAGDPIADFDGNGVLNIFDFLNFQNQFADGC